MRTMKTWHRITVALSVAAVVVAACGDGGSNATTTSPDSVVADEPTTTGADRMDREPTQPPERVPGDIAPGVTGGVTGEVPDEFLQPVIAEAADLAGVDPADTQVVTAQEMQWPDGSLGCAEPGMAYTQAIVAGYWVIIEAGGEGYDYRLDDRGSFRLCTTRLTGPGGTAPTE
jgi:hypothetical protein